MQWLSRVDILNSAVQAIICHTGTQTPLNDRLIVVGLFQDSSEDKEY